jgi:hypothetical protein
MASGILPILEEPIRGKIAQAAVNSEMPHRFLADST